MTNQETRKRAHIPSLACAMYPGESSSRLTVMKVQYVQDSIRVRLPLDVAGKWAGSDRISLSLSRASDSGPSLLMEKDFQCLHREERNPADTADAFPNPAGDQRGAR